MRILGLTAWFHDSSACLLEDGHVTAYAEEERFNRDKHTNAFPRQAVAWALNSRGLHLDQVDEVVFYLNPWRYLRTGIRSALGNLPHSLRLASSQAASRSPIARLIDMARLKSILCKEFAARGDFRVRFVDHYRTHQASAFYASGMPEAAVITMDFAVDGTTEVIAHGQGLTLTDRMTHQVPHAFAMVFAAVTHLLGFKWWDEYKVMGMAAYGEPRYLDAIRQLYHLDPRTGALTLKLDCFEFHRYGRNRLFSNGMVELLGPARATGAPITQREYDLAASLQAATTEYGLIMARLARELTRSPNLCMAGGVAQNCLMNQAICDSGLFENVFLQPLASDVGSSLGAALYAQHHHHRQPRNWQMGHLYLGPSYQEEAPRQAAAMGLTPRRLDNDWRAVVAQAIADGAVVGYFDGPMEVGPRALGGRSILVDPRRGEMKDILNSRVKHREHFRPFAPSVLEEEVETVFEPLPACRSLSYMITTMTVRPAWRERVPAITHADGTARVQTVRQEWSPNYHAIIRAFHELTGVPLVLNTSFNDNEPIVCRPEDAIRCFQRTRIDLLVMEGRLYYRTDNAHAVQGGLAEGTP